MEDIPETTLAAAAVEVLITTLTQCMDTDILADMAQVPLLF